MPSRRTWKEDHVHRHLRSASGILQAEGYKATPSSTRPGPTGRFREATCWAHLRRDSRDVWITAKSANAREGFDRIGALYDIEREIPFTQQTTALLHASSTAPRRSRPALHGLSANWPSSPVGAIWPAPSATARAASPASASFLKMTGLPSTTIPPNVPCVRSASAERTGSSPGLIPVPKPSPAP